MAYNITDRGQIIDIGTISKGCTQIEEAGMKFKECAEKVYAASQICDAKALSVDKTTMQSQLDADAGYIESIQTAIDDFTTEIRNIAGIIYGEQESELQSYQISQAANNSGTTTTP